MSGNPDGKRVRGARPFFSATAAGIVLYVVLDAIAQSLPPHYSPISQAESDLAVGPYGYIMALNFVNRGIFSLLFVYGLASIVSWKGPFKTGLALLGVWGAGALMLSVSPTDVSGPATAHGTVHLVVAGLAFLSAAVGAVSISRAFAREPALKGLGRYTEAIATLALVFFLFLFFGPSVLPRFASKVGGLTERIFIGLVLAWMLAVSAYMLRLSGSEVLLREERVAQSH